MAGPCEYGWEDPIDAMIDDCDPVCAECGKHYPEGEYPDEECGCEEFVPVDDGRDFDDLMRRISGAWDRS